jgi:hypothetical protein
VEVGFFEGALSSIRLRYFSNNNGAWKTVCVLTLQMDVGLALYVADNLSTFEYKLQEEVMVIVQQLSMIVSTCTPLVSTLESAVVDGLPTDLIDGKEAIIGTKQASLTSGLTDLPGATGNGQSRSPHQF